MKVEVVRPFAYLDISIGGVAKGRIVLELYDDLAPKAAENFLNICKTTKTDQDGNPITYKHNYFHRALKNFVIQAGDIVNCKKDMKYMTEKAGTGNVSTLEGGLFGLENTDEPIDGPFMLCTANTDPTANGSQFFITTYAQPHLTGKHTVFGKVKHGKSIVREIERVNSDKNNFPLEEEMVLIENCGEWDESMDIPIYNACYDQIGGDIYEEYPDDDENIDKESSELVYNASTKMKESGTLLLKQGRKKDALFKYVKCLRYIMEYIPDEEQEPEWFVKYYDMKKKLYLNVSLVNLQLPDYKRTIDYATYLLDMDNLTDQDKGKGFYRRGLAYSRSNKFSEAIKDLKQAEELVPSDETIKKELANAESLLANKKDQEKSRYAKFFK